MTVTHLLQYFVCFLFLFAYLCLCKSVEAQSVFPQTNNKCQVKLLLSDEPPISYETQDLHEILSDMGQVGQKDGHLLSTLDIKRHNSLVLDLNKKIFPERQIHNPAPLEKNRQLLPENKIRTGVSVSGREKYSPLLSQEHIRLYKRLFELQEVGRWEEADKIIQQLERQDDRLLGHVWFQRYMHPTKYYSSFEELASWLKQYGEYPEAMRIYRLALSRLPPDTEPPLVPITRQNSVSGGNLEILSLLTMEQGHIFPQAPNFTQNNQYLNAQKQVKKALQINKEEALKVFNTYIVEQHFTPLENDALRSFLASEFYYKGHHQLAYTLAEASIQKNGHVLPDAYMIMGLVSWHTKKFTDAALFFTKMAEYSFTPEQFSQAYFWAGRSFFQLHDQENAIHSFEQASRAQRTFYGLLSQHLLNKEHRFYWNLPPLTIQDIQKLSQNPAGRRAVALLQVQQYDRAEAELLSINLQKNPELIDTLISLSVQEKLPALAMQLGNTYTPQAENTYYDAALYPFAHWRPYRIHNVYTIDHALLYALIRQESRFNIRARSTKNAQGLMQILPETAEWIQQNIEQQITTLHPNLFNPQYNLTLGQWYIQHLLNHPGVRSNLLMLLIAYNAGPGNLRTWQKKFHTITDSLLFLETLPFQETRNFIKQVLINYWIYRFQFKQQSCALDAIAKGEWPLYQLVSLSIDIDKQLLSNTPPQKQKSHPMVRMVRIQRSTSTNINGIPGVEE